MSPDFEQELDIYVEAVLEKKAEGIVVLDVRGLTSIADAVIICSGRSNRQVSAIAENIQRFLRNHRIRPLSVEGLKDGHWVLLDYGHVIIHVFYESTRFFYDLEGLWSDAIRVVPPSLRRLATISRQDVAGDHIIVE